MNGGHKHGARTVFEHAASPPAYLCLLRYLPTAGTALTPSENMGGQGGRGNCSRCWGSGLGERPPPRAGAEHSPRYTSPARRPWGEKDPLQGGGRRGRQRKGEEDREGATDRRSSEEQQERVQMHPQGRVGAGMRAWAPGCRRRLLQPQVHHDRQGGLIRILSLSLRLMRQ